MNFTLSDFKSSFKRYRDSLEHNLLASPATSDMGSTTSRTPFVTTPTNTFSRNTPRPKGNTFSRNTKGTPYRWTCHSQGNPFKEHAQENTVSRNCPRTFGPRDHRSVTAGHGFIAMASQRWQEIQRTITSDGESDTMIHRQRKAFPTTARHGLA